MSDDTSPMRREYTQSPIILTTARILAPFVLTYGLFITFHGADSPGGGFQGGVIIATTAYLLAFTFGMEPTRAWVGHRTMAILAAGGVIVFTGIGLATLALGGNFLEYTEFGALLDLPANELTKWGMEAVEIGGIAAIIAGVVMALVFLTAGGYEGGGESP